MVRSERCDFQTIKKNSNHIDGTVINEKGIFILEIKNYAGKKIWINQANYAVTETVDGR